MKKIQKSFIIIAILLAFSAAAIAAVSMRVFFDNREIPLRTVTSGGELYINAADLAEQMPERFVLDRSKNRLDIYSQEIKETEPAPGQDVPEKGIVGEVTVKYADGIETPVKNVEVFLFNDNDDVPDSAALAMLQEMFLKKDRKYFEAHGLVREGKTGQGGNFYFSAPPGKYELAAVYYTVPGEKGRFWRKTIELKKDELLKIQLNSDSYYNLNE